jgi:glycerophosphoryl diester phosphodiesterase
MVEKLQDWAQRAADLMCNLRHHPECDKPKPKTVAHRGAWDLINYSENTMKAFERARDLGAWGIELDIRFTRDNVPFVQHDPDLRRCYGRPEELCEFKATDLRKAAPAMPMLEEVLALQNLHFMLEVKTALTPDQIIILNRHLAKLKPIENYHLLTLNPELVRESPALPLPAWILVGEVNLKTLTKISLERGLGGVAGHYLLLTGSLIEQLHEREQKAGSGFLPTKNLFNREWNRGVDWVFTNHLGALVAKNTLRTE